MRFGERLAKRLERGFAFEELQVRLSASGDRRNYALGATLRVGLRRANHTRVNAVAMPKRTDLVVSRYGMELWAQIRRILHLEPNRLLRPRVPELRELFLALEQRTDARVGIDRQ